MQDEVLPDDGDVVEDERTGLRLLTSTFMEQKIRVICTQRTKPPDGEVVGATDCRIAKATAQMVSPGKSGA